MANFTVSYVKDSVGEAHTQDYNENQTTTLKKRIGVESLGFFFLFLDFEVSAAWSARSVALLVQGASPSPSRILAISII